MRFVSVCSGIEAASVAWAPLGWSAVAFSEIEPFPCSLLAHHYPSVPNLGDMTNFKDWPDVGTVDLLCGGTPCQSFSVAGLRGGLDDPRGNLMLTFGAIAERYRPRWLVWENVPGVLSTDGGRDFGSFLGLLGELGYGFAYRILDAQHFGVPQRRRRVFVVGHLGSWQRAAAVLFERHSLQGNPPPRRKAWQGSPVGALRSTDGGSDLEHARARQLVEQPFGVANCLTERMHKGINTTIDEGQTPVLVFDPLQITSWANGNNPQFGDPCHTLPAVAQPPLMIRAFTSDGVNADPIGASEARTYTNEGTTFRLHNCVGVEPIAFDTYNQVVTGDQAQTLCSRGDTPGGNAHLIPAVAFKPSHYTRGKDGAPSEVHPPLSREADKGDQDSLILAFDCKATQASEGETAPTLRAMTHANSHADAGGQIAVAFQERGSDGGRNLEIGGDIAVQQARSTGSAWHSRADTTQQERVRVGTMAVRRLTPVECEKLQGFPPGYTDVRHRGKPAADGPRYKALGNSWAVPCVRWIGERIAAVDKL